MTVALSMDEDEYDFDDDFDEIKYEFDGLEFLRIEFLFILIVIHWIILIAI